MTRLARVLAVCVAAASLISVAPPRASALGRPCASGAMHVALVVDFGGGAAGTCVPARSGMSDLDVLRSQHSVTTNASGLICSIDGVPSTGCGKETSGGYAYWSYWHGTGGHWSYANDNFATYEASEDIVQGWRWQPSGKATAADPPPGGSPNATSICVPAPPAPQGNPSPPPSPGGNAPPNKVGPHATSSSGSAAGAPTTAPTGTASTASTSAHASDSPATTFDALGASASARPHGSSSSGPPIGLFLGLALIAALAAGGIVIARRRRATT